MTAHDGATATGGNISLSALGPNSRVVIGQYVEADSPEVEWPVLVGSVPALASGFQPRTSLWDRVDAAHGRGDSVVLASDYPGDRQAVASAAQVLAGGGGVGKSQLAAACARDAQNAGKDLVLWAPAADVQQVITIYAQAAQWVRAPGVSGQDHDLESDARAFLVWLASTTRQWMVVLDDITDPDAIAPWWPDERPGTGRVLATTRLQDPRLTGGGRTRIDVDVFTPAEATDFLIARLAHDDKSHLVDDRADDLAKALGYLPLALGHAAAYVIREQIPCRSYLHLFTDKAARLEEVLPPWADTERYGRQVTTTLLLALDAAERDEHGPLASVAIRLVALLDPAGHPGALWDTTATTTYLTKHRPNTPTKRSFSLRRRKPANRDEIRSVLTLLHRYGLLTYDSPNAPRTVRIHALTARAVREANSDREQAAAINAAAGALLQAWPDVDHAHPYLASVLRANTDALATHAGERVWHLVDNSVLYRSGMSLLDAGLNAAATSYWISLASDSERILGPDHPDTLSARANLATSYVKAGRFNDAIALEERVVADFERIRFPGHPDTLTARNNLAISYAQAGRINDAITLGEQVVAGFERTLGRDHPDTVSARGNLASAYQEDERINDAITLEEQVVADRERILGPDHPNTLTARHNLAISYVKAGRINDAITLEEQVVADLERILGPDHPNTVGARGNLAGAYQEAGRINDAITLEEQVVADRERILGPDHPNTLTARNNLAISYAQAGRINDAITLGEQVVADRERILGPDHPNTLTARNNLAVSYREAGQEADGG
ncbi:FxSxx-COOH system tetratricopeptide repeat protein [Streptomyces sp. LN325]|uniref:FxSxx-COOH system tetratricopeptide repeat protein n=1 Tax=Streptomyces sp. LN325 TaxID=3112976 RepID=UPI003710AC8B